MQPIVAPAIAPVVPLRKDAAVHDALDALQHTAVRQRDYVRAQALKECAERVSTSRATVDAIESEEARAVAARDYVAAREAADKLLVVAEEHERMLGEVMAEANGTAAPAEGQYTPPGN